MALWITLIPWKPGTMAVSYTHLDVYKRQDYIPDEDYVEESDPGDTYYWYDGEGNVMYFDGSDSYYIGPDDVF